MSRACASASFRRTAACQGCTRAARPRGSASVSARSVSPMWLVRPTASGRLRPSSTGSQSTMATWTSSAKDGGRP